MDECTLLPFVSHLLLDAYLSAKPPSQRSETTMGSNTSSLPEIVKPSGPLGEREASMASSSFLVRVNLPLPKQLNFVHDDVLTEIVLGVAIVFLDLQSHDIIAVLEQ